VARSASATLAAASASPPPTVSVITAFLDAERFLEATIESVLAQTYPGWELLLVDDGSRDASSAIARAYAARYPAQIRCLEHASHANLGKSVSRNLGLWAGTGRYVAFLDADDVLRPDKLEVQVRLLERETEAVMLYGPTDYWYSWDGLPESADRAGKLGVEPDRLYLPPRLLTLYLRDPGTVPCLCGLLIHAQIARQVGGFDEAISDLYEDQVFIAKMVLAGGVYVDATSGERYRQHDGSSSARAIASGDYHPTRPHPSRRVYLEWLEAHLARRNLLHGALRRALRDALLPYRHSRLAGAVARIRALTARRSA
jgi:glycosyltransferase involved in cell wall biosynthesis